MCAIKIMIYFINFILIFRDFAVRRIRGRGKARRLMVPSASLRVVYMHGNYSSRIKVSLIRDAENILKSRRDEGNPLSFPL